MACLLYLHLARILQAIGINCTAPEYISELLRNIRPHTDKLIAIYPNSGEKYEPTKFGWEEGDTKCYDANGGLQAFAELSLEWRKLGANIIGGCCRILPIHIKKLNEYHSTINSDTFKVDSIDEIMEA